MMRLNRDLVQAKIRPKPEDSTSWPVGGVGVEVCVWMLRLSVVMRAAPINNFGESSLKVVVGSIG